MPIEDDDPCFFCGATLWNFDGLLACASEKGCGAYERFLVIEGANGQKDISGIEWVVSQEQVFKTFKVKEQKA